MNIQEVINIASKFDAKGFKQAETASQKLGRTVKNLAGTLGLAFGTTAIVAYGKASVRVALQAQAEQERLNNILRVTTGATLAQIDVLNQQADALERIGVVSAGNIKTTQSQLATFDLQISTIKALTPAILDYVTAEKGATASASDFKSMTNGLAQALNGNFTSLTRTGFVLDEVTRKMIKEGTETERVTALVKVLNSTYKDFNANLRATDSGQMQVLANTAQEVQTIIGTGIIDALKLLSNDKTIENLSTDMKDFATAVSDTLMGISMFVNELKNIPLIGKALGNIFDKIGSGIIFTQMGREQRERLAYNPNEHRARQQAVKLDRESAKLAKTSNQLKKIDNDSTERKIVLTGDQLALAELEKKFDVERIGLYAALNQTTDSETKMRLLSLIAIHDQNAAMAGMIKKANEAENAFATLVEALRATIRSMLDSIKPQVQQLQQLTQPQSGFGSGANTPIEEQRAIVREKLDLGMPSLSTLQNLLAAQGVPGYSRTSFDSPSVTVNVTGSVTTERDLVAAITQGLYAQQASGTPVNYSTAY
jgi:phosphoribosyl-dephospho-CoA transferase